LYKIYIKPKSSTSESFWKNEDYLPPLDAPAPHFNLFPVPEKYRLPVYAAGCRTARDIS